VQVWLLCKEKSGKGKAGLSSSESGPKSFVCGICSGAVSFRSEVDVLRCVVVESKRSGLETRTRGPAICWLSVVDRVRACCAIKGIAHSELKNSPRRPCAPQAKFFRPRDEQFAQSGNSGATQNVEWTRRSGRALGAGLIGASGFWVLVGLGWARQGRVGLVGDTYVSYVRAGTKLSTGRGPGTGNVNCRHATLY
jgi:hypothetical protein